MKKLASPNLKLAQQWATAIAGKSTQRFHFQLIQDKKVNGKRKAHTRNGTVAQCFDALCNDNKRGYGVFVCTNALSGDQRLKGSVKRVLAWYTDIDDNTEPEYPITPTMVVRTRNGRHVYFRTKGTATIDRAFEINRGIAKVMGGDPNSCDVVHVLRLPGFYHHKQDPFFIDIEKYNPKAEYTEKQICEAFSIGAAEEPDVLVNEGTDTKLGIKIAEIEVGKLAATGEGSRNKTLNETAFKLGVLIQRDELSTSTALRMLTEACESNGYIDEHTLDHTNSVVQSAFNAAAKAKPEILPDAPDVDPVVEVVPEVDINTLTFDARWPASHALLKKRMESGHIAISGPIEGLNYMLGGGLFIGGTTLLSAPPGAGKTSFALQWGRTALKNNYPVVLVTLELTEVDVVARLFTFVSDAKWIDARRGIHLPRMTRALKKEYSGKPFFIITPRDNGFSPDVIISHVKKVRDEYKRPILVIIDYIQRLAFGAGKDDLRQRMNDISIQISQLAQDADSAFLCISAVNRASYNVLDKQTNRPDLDVALAAAKETGALEYDAEGIIGIHLFDAPTPDADQTGWVFLPKNRSGGPTGMVPVIYAGRSGMFTETTEADLEIKHEKDEDGPDRKTLVRLIEKGVSIRRIPKELGIGYEKVADMVRELTAAKIIKKNPKTGRYDIVGADIDESE